MKRICPKCGKKYTGYPAISRDDNKTEICPDCGVIEAIRDYLKDKPEGYFDKYILDTIEDDEDER